MRSLCILIIALVCIPFVSAKETFYSSLDSAKVVEVRLSDHQKAPDEFVMTLAIQPAGKVTTTWAEVKSR